MRAMQNTSHNTSILFHQSLEGGQFQKRYLMVTKEIYIWVIDQALSSGWLDIGLDLFLHRGK